MEISMGRRGPPKTPTELKLLRGVPGGVHKLTPDEPKPEKVMDTPPPSDLSERAKQVWSDIAPRLERLGLLTEIDLSMLARYCDIYVRWVEARDFLDGHGSTYAIYHEQTEAEVKAGRKKRLKWMAQFPQVNIYQQLGKDLTRIEQQFGMSPAARSSISVKPKEPGNKDITSKLYGIK